MTENNHHQAAQESNLVLRDATANPGSEILIKHYLINHNRQQLSLRQTFFYSILHNLKWIILLFIVVLLAAFSIYLLTPNVYKAKASLEFTQSSKSIGQKEYSGNVNQQLNRSLDGDNLYLKLKLVKQLAEKIDPKNFEKLLSNEQDFYLNDFLSFFKHIRFDVNQLAFTSHQNRYDRQRKLLNAIEVHQSHDGKYFEVFTYAADANVAANTANAAIFAIQEMIDNHQYEANKKIFTMYENKLADSKRQYEMADHDRQFFIASNNMLTPEQRTARHEELKEKVEFLNSRMADLQRQYKDLSQNDKKFNPPTLHALLDQKTSLEQEYQNKLLDLKPKHPEMIDLTSRIEQLGLRISSQKKQLTANIRSQLKQNKLRLDTALQRLQQFESERSAFEAFDFEYGHLNQKFERTKAVYDSLRRDYDALQTNIAKSNRELININYAVSPLLPLKKSLNNTFLIFGIFALLGSILIIVLSISRGQFYRSRQEIESDFGIPVIASIPNMRNAKKMHNLFTGLLSQTDQTMNALYKEAAKRLYFSNKAGTPRIFAISSAIDGEGKTLTSIALALDYAAGGQRVLLVDLHLRNPQLDQIFNLDAQKGLTDILVSDEAPINVTHETSYSNLYVICSGPKPGNPMQLLSTKSFDNFLEIAKQKFDLVILDCPPINKLDEMLLIGGLVDHLVVCVKTTETTKTSIKKAIKKMLTVNCLPTGFILTHQPKTNLFGVKGSSKIINVNKYTPITSK
jgi:capsular exopolysaccharide synthesis family protein